ncbi:ATP phosphoribosyltransferase [Salinibacillus xinjiangensis]|uniref:ATP phosphoribosyltransferase n=1 Tax=Salinibacillus xinjiangensis TaxID=1229268 RepID=A0A6G1X8I4_9BACI|nr:ATP phosphoribosyltransferase [Salinibacillus xinjiangensis]MRG87252.1 ATP phosphoribosyltransferase [Salinibacillus xinjiangensis]
MSEVKIALAKGRLEQLTLAAFQEIGIEFPDFTKDSRKLIFEDKNHQYQIVLVKASDVPTYVEKGAADIGIVGKDTLLENGADVFEVLDLGFGRCKFAVAGLPEQKNNQSSKLTVASKYPKVAKDYYHKKGISIETIKLNGSVELAPLIGLSDVIVDIVETGRTLKENGLEVLEDISEISARLVVNKASFKTKTDRIHSLIQDIESVIEKQTVS